MKSALEGLKVLELTIWFMASAATVILADCGADVVKIEYPDGGDPVRGLTGTGILPLTAANYPFELVNRNKRSVAINLKRSKGREAAYKLVERSDVFVTNMRHSALERLGMQYEALSQINPRLVYAHGTGYGPVGPDRDRPAFDELAFWARSGIMSVLGQPGTPPVPLHGAFGDLLSGAIMSGGILAALFQRDRTSKGQKVDCSLYSCGIWAAAFDIQLTLLSGEDATRMSRKSTGNPLYNIYQAKDGKWFQFVMPETERYWPSVCKAIGREDLTADPRFDTHDKRCQNDTEARAILDQVLATKTRTEWASVFDEHKLVWAPHSLLTDIISDPQALVNNFFPEVTYLPGQKMRVVGSPFQLSKVPLEVKSPAPALGQHTEEVLLELGYTWEDIQELKEEKAII